MCRVERYIYTLTRPQCDFIELAFITPFAATDGALH